MDCQECELRQSVLRGMEQKCWHYRMICLQKAIELGLYEESSLMIQKLMRRKSQHFGDWIEQRKAIQLWQKNPQLYQYKNAQIKPVSK